jgi:hypothetical protein
MPDGMLIAVILIGLASYRLWRIVGRDQIADPIRVWLINREGRFWTFVGDLLHCAWCLGWWLAGAITVALFWGSPLLHIALIWCGASAVAGLLGMLDDLLSRRLEA